MVVGKENIVLWYTNGAPWILTRYELQQFKHQSKELRRANVVENGIQWNVWTQCSFRLLAWRDQFRSIAPLKATFHIKGTRKTCLSFLGRMPYRKLSRTNATTLNIQLNTPGSPSYPNTFSSVKLNFDDRGKKNKTPLQFSRLLVVQTKCIHSK